MLITLCWQFSIFVFPKAIFIATKDFSNSVLLVELPFRFKVLQFFLNVDIPFNFSTVLKRSWKTIFQNNLKARNDQNGADGDGKTTQAYFIDPFSIGLLKYAQKNGHKVCSWKCQIKRVYLKCQNYENSKSWVRKPSTKKPLQWFTISTFTGSIIPFLTIKLIF